MIDIPKKIGFIGAGRMGGALISGVKESVTDIDIWAAVKSEKSRIESEKKHGISVLIDYKNELASTDILFLATEPAQIQEVCEVLSESDLSKDSCVVSVAAGVSTSSLNKYLDGKFRIVRIMPNLACRYGSGVLLVSRGPRATQDTVNTLESLIKPLGLSVEIDEKHMDTGTAISASGPAFILSFFSALLESAELLGMPEDQAGKILLQTFKGSMDVLEKTGEGPEALIKNITTPGGCTFAGLGSLEKSDFNQIVKSAIKATEKRASELGE